MFTYEGLQEEVRLEVDDICFFHIEALCAQSGWKNVDKKFFVRLGCTIQEGLIPIYHDDSSRALHDEVLNSEHLFIYMLCMESILLIVLKVLKTLTTIMRMCRKLYCLMIM